MIGPTNSWVRHAVIAGIILSLVATGLLVAYRASDHVRYWLDDLLMRDEIHGIAVGSSSVISLPLDFFESCSGFVKRGFGGGTLDDLSAYLSFSPLPASLKLILIYAGENDVVYGESVAQTFSRFQTFTSRLTEEFPQASLIIIEAKLAPARSGYHGQIRTLNESLKRLESNPRVKVVGSTLSERVLPALYLADGVHLNREGYELFLEEVPKEC